MDPLVLQSSADTSVRLFAALLKHRHEIVVMFTEILRQLIFERPILALTLCWVEGFVVGGLLIYWLFV